MPTIQPFICNCSHSMALHSAYGEHPCRQCDCSSFHQREEYLSVYVMIAFDDSEKIGECIVVESLEAAQLLYKHLRKLWRNVAMISRQVNDIPVIVLEAM